MPKYHIIIILLVRVFVRRKSQNNDSIPLNKNAKIGMRITKYL